MSTVIGYKMKRKKGKMTGNYRCLYEQSVRISPYNYINNGIKDNNKRQASFDTIQYIIAYN